MKVKNVSIKDIIFAEYNPRRLTNDQAKNLKDSLERFGFVDPVVINSHPTRKNILVGGHQRVRIWQSMGRKTVPGVYVSLDRDKERELNIRLNKNVGEWSWEDLANNFSQEELVEWGFTEEELLGGIEVKTEETEGNDDVPDSAPPLTKLGDLYELGGHRLLCGDSAQQSQVSRLFGGFVADMVFTDPPYGVNYEQKAINILGRKDRASITGDGDGKDILKTVVLGAFKNVFEFLKTGGAYYVCSPQGGELGLMMMMMMIEAGIECRHMIVWKKDSPVFSMGRLDYDYQHEPILYGWKGSHKFFGNGQHKTSIWDIPRPKVSKLHPTMKPVEVVENAIQNSSKQNEIVLDLFGGSGTTIIASERALRKCFMVEIDPVYCDVIVKRYADFCQKNNREWLVKRNGVDVSKQFINNDLIEKYDKKRELSEPAAI